MKSVYIIHGWDGRPDEKMLESLRLKLEEKNIRVIAPSMPDPEVPIIEKWIGKINEIVSLEDEVIFVGHSIGCQAVLRYIEQSSENLKILGIVLIAPWMELDMQTLEEEGEESREIAKLWMETPIDFEKIRSRIKYITTIFSDNDPYVPLSQKELFENNLGAKIVVESEKGHFTEDDGVNELPSALMSVEKILEIND